jgi:TfoX/Sxy family transcriptional regulator of competence genes
MPLTQRKVNRIAKSGFVEVIIVNEFIEYVRESFSTVGDIVIKAMMGGYLVYLNGKLIGDICDNELFLKRTPTSDRLLSDSELRYPYEGSKTLMHVFDRFEDTDLIAELLEGLYTELPEKKPKKAK